MNTKLLLAAVAITAAGLFAQGRNNLRYVDPYIGSGGHGHVFVGASVPFGQMQAGPQNIFKGWDWCSGYHYSDSILVGFSHTHLSGTGCTDLGDLQLMPFTGDVRTSRGSQDDIEGCCSSYYSHENEKVTPYRYSLLLDNGINVKLTATCRVACHEYEYPAGVEKRLLVNLFEGNGSTVYDASITRRDGNTVTGYRFVHGWAPEHRVYFAIQTNVPIDELMVFDADTPAGSDSLRAVNVKAVATFAGTGRKIRMKVATSSVSEENALGNIKAEVPGWNFKKVEKAARRCWKEELSKVNITTKSEKAKKIFYTAMYHTMVAPTTYCDSNGEYRGHDGKVHRTSGTNYSTFSCWDTYRALHPWFTIIQHDRLPDMMNSMMDICDQQGKLPIWPLLGGETNQMPGYGSVAILSDAVLKDIPGIDPERALGCAIRTATNRDQGGIDYLLDTGYIPADKVNEATSKAMEYAISDWGIGAMAQKNGHDKEAEYYFGRARSGWQSYFDREIGFIRPKFTDGSWLDPYNPFTSVHEVGYFAEGNGWQYTFLVPQDPYALIEALGGDEGFCKKLDTYFSISGDMGPQASADISGLIGQYAHGNEPSHHVIYLYNYAGQQWKAAKLVRKVQEDFYTDATDGLIGNEDCGQMSAWHILSAIGFFQVNPSCGVYSFGSPLFEQAKLTLPGGKTFTVAAKGNSGENIYIRRAFLNGEEITRSYITYNEIMQGGKLEFEMGSEPNKGFGSANIDRPYNEIR